VQIMECPQIRTVAIIAEGVPERRTRTLIRMAKELRVTLIGPATVRSAAGTAPGDRACRR
jgi:ATP citrate (pro-S)-lyase